MPYKTIKEEKNLSCQFCNSKARSILKYGDLYKLEDVVAHYHCLLLSTNMVQNGKDNEGIFGFLLSDIKAELEKSQSRKCCYCKKTKASIFCCHPKCKKIFHLPCGQKNFCLNQFLGQFQSFCFKHRPAQKIQRQILKEAEKSKMPCPICFKDFGYSQPPHDRLWAPCCGKAWFHKKCIQLLAYSAGYFFKCPMCNNKKKFESVMSRLGIFIPQRDASWELEPNAYQDLLFRYNNCDAEVCYSAWGRERSFENSKWEIVICQSCGSQGTHKRCGNLPRTDSKWECALCSKVGQKNQCISNGRNSGESSVKHRSSSSRGKSKRKRSLTSEDEKHAQHKRKSFKSSETAGEENPHESDGEDHKGSESEESVEIDVVTVETNEPQRRKVLEAYSKLKPGPLSYKLNLIRNIFGSSPTAKIYEEIELSSGTQSEGSESNLELQRERFEPEVICLSDSDDGEEDKGEDEGDSDVEIIKEPEKLTDSRISDTHGREKGEFQKELANVTEDSVNVSHPETQVPRNRTPIDMQSFSLFSISAISNIQIVGSYNLFARKNNTEEVR